MQAPSRLQNGATSAAQRTEVSSERAQHFDAAAKEGRPVPHRRFSVEIGVLLPPPRKRQRQSLDDNMLRDEPSRFKEVVREIMQQRSGHTALVEPPSPALEPTDGKDQRYAEMMERFQIRKIMRSPSASSNISAKATMRDATELPALTVASTSANGAPMTHGDNTVIDFPPFHPPERPSNVERASRFSIYWSWVAWKRRLARHAAALAEPISPASTVSRVRIALVVLAFVVHVMVFPLKMAFCSPSDLVLARMEVAIELVFVIDCVLMFNTAYFSKRNQLVTSRRRIIGKYLRGWFTLDLLSSLPVGTLMMISRHHSTQSHWWAIGFDVAVRSQRAVHIVRIARVLITVLRDSPERRLFEWLLYSRYSHLLRIVWIVLCIVLIAHYLACGWRLLSGSRPSGGTPLEEYVGCFYDVLQLLQGQGVPTTTVAQNVYATFAILIGSLLLAIVFGNVGILVSNFNANSTSYQRKMESVFAVMSKLQLPVPLRERIHQYYEHLWREYESLDGEIVAFSKGLSHTLELEVVLFKYMDLIMHVPFWRDASPDFQKQLMLSLQVRVYLPDDYIIRRGEVGDEFFMINRGLCVLELGPDSFECTTDPLHDDRESRNSDLESTSPVAKTSCYKPPSDRGGDLSDLRSTGERGDRVRPLEPATQGDKYTRFIRRGQSFGEIALIMNYERTANARASTYVEMCVLHRDDFQKILIKHPKDRKEVLTALLTKTMENNEATQVWCPLRATAQSVFSEGESDDSEPMSAMQAALLISNAVNRPLDDSTIQFGIGEHLHEQLVEWRDRQRQAASVAPDLHPTEAFQSEPVIDTPDPPAEATDAPLLAEQVQEMSVAQAHLTSLVVELLGEVRSLRDVNEQLRAAIRLQEGKPHGVDVRPGSNMPSSHVPHGLAQSSAKPILPHRLSRRSSSGSIGRMSIPEHPARTSVAREGSNSPNAKSTTSACQMNALPAEMPGRRKMPLNRRASFSSSNTSRGTVAADHLNGTAQLAPRGASSRRVLPALERPSPTMYADQLFERRALE